MTDSRTPRERLDTLIAGLEEEVLRSDRTGRRLADEGGSAEDVAAMRSDIESLIEARGGSEPLRPADAGASGPSSKVAQAMQRLGRWSGVVQGRGLSAATPQVRMAFSGKAKVRRSARKLTRGGRGGSVGAGQEDC